MKDSSVKRILSTEVKYIIGIATFVIGVIAPFYSMKQDVALIKENHYIHIENIQREIEDIKQDQVRLEERQIELMELIVDKL